MVGMGIDYYHLNIIDGEFFHQFIIWFWIMKYLLLLIVILGCTSPRIPGGRPIDKTWYYFSLDQWKHNHRIHYIQTSEGKILPFTDYKNVSGSHFPDRKFRHDMIYVGYGKPITKSDTMNIIWPLSR